MNKTAIRKLAIGSCMALTLLSGWAVSSAHAQRPGVVIPDQGSITLPGNITSNVDALTSAAQVGTDAVDMLRNGVSAEQAAQFLSSAGINISGASPQEILSLVQNIQNFNLNQVAAANLITNFISGNIPPDVAIAVSAINNFGNLGNASNLISALQGGGIANALQGLSTSQQAQALDSILQSAGLGGMTGTDLDQLAGFIDSAFPGLGDLVGGIDGISDLLASGGLGSVLGVGGGTPCCQICRAAIPQHHRLIEDEINGEWQLQQGWFISNFWMENILPALMLMAEQLTATGIAQVEMFGTMLDAKHQLETQRLFQTMTAEAHKDYQPSEGMCTFGSAVASLASSERKSDLAQVTFASRMMQRQTRNGANLTAKSDSDLAGRVTQFIAKYCDPADNQNGLSKLCQSAPADADKARHNMDVDFTRNIESRLTLNTDFLPQDGGDTNGATLNPDEEDVLALSANLFSNKLIDSIGPLTLATNTPDKEIYQDKVEKYMDLRAIFAKRSVAQNSFAAIAAQRAAGSPESAPYTKAILRELGVANDADINKIMGDNPSQFAQMEVLTKMIPQSPSFYVELIDKPTNVDRKGAALQAIGLMQDRDLYESLLRSEAVLSVLLETMLMKEQDKYTNILNDSGDRNEKDHYCNAHRLPDYFR